MASIFEPPKESKEQKPQGPSAPAQDPMMGEFLGGAMPKAQLDQFNQNILLTVTAVNQLKTLFTVRGA